jgi:uncharacterized membrane protein (DUF2068 family)
VEWGLLVCSLRGHETYAPDEPELHGALLAQTLEGSAWRCLRCETFVVGAPKGAGPARQGPEVARGPALRDLIIIRLIATERSVRALFLFAMAWAVVAFRSRQGGLRVQFEQFLPLLGPLAQRMGWRIQDSWLVHTVELLLHYSATWLLLLAVGLALYGCLQLAEAVGLWLGRRWGEYLAVIATSAFIPLEVYEIIERPTWVRIGALLFSFAAVIWLIYAKRLFGVRGGAAAQRAQHEQTSLLSVQRAATGSRPAPRVTD